MEIQEKQLDLEKDHFKNVESFFSSLLSVSFFKSYSNSAWAKKIYLDLGFIQNINAPHSKYPSPESHKLVLNSTIYSFEKRL